MQLIKLIYVAVLGVALFGGCAPVSTGKTVVQELSFPYITQDQGVFNGKKITYAATVGALDVPDSDGNPGARIVSTSYIAKTGESAAKRPVMFVFNGGPISPSLYLHMGAFGPKRVAFPDDLSADAGQAPLVDNPFSILDVTDLVYFDPAGTGFSRVLPGKPLKDYFSVTADAQQTAAFIAAWLRVNGRLDSPVFMFGESYGTNRAVETAGQLAQLPQPVLLDGVVLFGQAVNIIEYAQRQRNIISYVVSLPTLAAIGWYHGKVDRSGIDFEGFVEAAWDYARTDYLLALFEGNNLAPERMREVAMQLERFSGLPAEYFVEQRLRVSKENYRLQLFKPEGLLIGRSDGRYLGPAESAEEGQPPTDPAAALPMALIGAIRQYLVADLGLPTADGYIVTSPVKGLNDWGWGGSSPFAPFSYGDALTGLLEANPRCRVLVAAGHHDTMTTTGASRYLIDHENWPRERVMLKFYQGGHMAYSVEASARALADDLRLLVRAPQ